MNEKYSNLQKSEDGNYYKPCNEKQAKCCKKYVMLICTDCPHGIKVESEVKQNGY